MKYTDAEKKRAVKADLISLPKGLSERCSNCKYIQKHRCVHPEVRLMIEKPEDECCGFWDSDKIIRRIS